MTKVMLGVVSTQSNNAKALAILVRLLKRKDGTGEAILFVLQVLFDVNRRCRGLKRLHAYELREILDDMVLPYSDREIANALMALENSKLAVSSEYGWYITGLGIEVIRELKRKSLVDSMFKKFLLKFAPSYSDTESRSTCEGYIIPFPSS